MIGKVALLLTASCALLHADPLADGIAAFRKAEREWDCAEFWNATRELNRAVAAQPQNAEAHAWLGTAHFHRMLQIQSRPATDALRAAAEGDSEAAIKALTKAVELDAGQAEAQAMLATLYGMKIHGALGAVRYGRQVQSHRDAALKQGAKNPRVRYLMGVALLRTAEKEADRQKALESLLAAEILFEDEAKSPPPPEAPAWGRAACLAFIGEAYSRLHKPANARDYYRKALQLRPKNRMAKDGLARLKNE